MSVFATAIEALVKVGDVCVVRGGFSICTAALVVVAVLLVLIRIGAVVLLQRCGIALLLAVDSIGTAGLLLLKRTSTFATLYLCRGCSSSGQAAWPVVSGF